MLYRALLLAFVAVVTARTGAQAHNSMVAKGHSKGGSVHARAANHLGSVKNTDRHQKSKQLRHMADLYGKSKQARNMKTNMKLSEYDSDYVVGETYEELVKRCNTCEKAEDLAVELAEKAATEHWAAVEAADTMQVASDNHNQKQNDLIFAQAEVEKGESALLGAIDDMIAHLKAIDLDVDDNQADNNAENSIDNLRHGTGDGTMFDINTELSKMGVAISTKLLPSTEEARDAKLTLSEATVAYEGAAGTAANADTAFETAQGARDKDCAMTPLMASPSPSP